jgi:hypothetical protein
VIKTAWHPIKIRQTTGDSQPTSPNAGPQTGTFTGQSSSQKFYFVRFNVYIVGGKPWRVRVEGQASSWVIGEVPTPLKGAEIPPWLGARTDSLRVEIHDRLKKFAVALEDPKPATKPIPRREDVVEVEKGKYANVPPAAAEVIKRVYRAAVARDAATIRAAMADEFVWSHGGGDSADVAIAMWQADTTLLEQIAALLDAGCRLTKGGSAAAEGAGNAGAAATNGAGVTEVSCPPAYTEQDDYRGYRVGFREVGGTWKMVYFLQDD